MLQYLVMRKSFFLAALFAFTILYISTAPVACIQSSNDTRKSSKGENMSSSQPSDAEIQQRDAEIQRLNKEATDARGKSDFWDTATVIVLWAAAFAAGLTATFAIKLNTSKNALINKQVELAAAKEERQAVQLHRLDDDLTKAKKALSEQQERAAKAETARLHLEELIQPRGFSAAEEGRIIIACRPFAGHHVRFETQAFDIEAAQLAFRMRDILTKAGITAVTFEVGSLISSGEIIFDVHINGPHTERNLMRALAASLPTESVVVASTSEENNRGVVIILVGAKRFPTK